MPVVVRIQFLKGKPYTVVERCMSEVTELLMDILDEQPENIRIAVTEVEKNRFSVGGKLLSEPEDKID